MPAITLTDLTFSYTADPLLEAVSFSVVNGERACLIGPNGCGKSTLLSLVTGDLVPRRGSAEITGIKGGAAGLRRAPDVHAMTGTVGDCLDAATAPIRALSARFEEVNAALASGPSPAKERRLSREFDELLVHMEAAEAWSLDVRIETTLAGLGLSIIAGKNGRARDLATLSPGQRGRLELAATLLASPSVLVLDEPTNHLDAEAARYLSALLKAFEGPILFASHDRAFIDETATVLLDLDTAPWQALLTATGQAPLAGVHRCAGGYADYLERKAKARAGHAKLHAAQQEEKKSIRVHRRSAEDIQKGGIRLKEATPFQRKFFADRASKTMTRRTPKRRQEDGGPGVARGPQAPRIPPLNGPAASQGGERFRRCRDSKRNRSRQTRAHHTRRAHGRAPAPHRPERRRKVNAPAVDRKRHCSDRRFDRLHRPRRATRPRPPAAPRNG